MFALCLTGLLGITVTGDAFNIFVFLEISSLSTYVLIALGRDRRALVAAYQYLIMGTIGATFIVIGIGLLYLMTGTLNMADMAHRLAAVRGTRPVLAALAFLTVGISLKLALFPLHQWLPNAYTYAPSAVSAFLAATATKVAVYVLLRFYFTVFGEPQVFDRLPLPQIMLLLALAGMFVGLVDRDLPDRPEAPVRLFQRRARSATSSLGLVVRLADRADRRRSCTSSTTRMTKGAMFLLLGGVCAASWAAPARRLRGPGPAHAADQRRHRRLAG